MCGVWQRRSMQHRNTRSVHSSLQNNCRTQQTSTVLQHRCSYDSCTAVPTVTGSHSDAGALQTARATARLPPLLHTLGLPDLRPPASRLSHLASYSSTHPASSRLQGAARFALNEDNRPYFRRARRKLGKKLLETPIAELLALNELEMAILRDSVWTAIQEFRLPNEVPASGTQHTAQQ